MPVIKKPFDWKSKLVTGLRQASQPDLDDSVRGASIKGGLLGSLAEAADIFLPGADELPMVGMAGGGLRPPPKGLRPGSIRGFVLPDGKVAQPDAEGTARIVEGDAAIKSLQKMVARPHSAINRESGFVPAIGGADELSDVKVPIADSLDTPMAPGAPLSGKWDTQAAHMARRSKLSEQDVRKIRELYETGAKTVTELQAMYPDVAKQSIAETARRLNFPRIK